MCLVKNKAFQFRFWRTTMTKNLPDKHDCTIRGGRRWHARLSTELGGQADKRPGVRLRAAVATHITMKTSVRSLMHRRRSKMRLRSTRDLAGVLMEGQSRIRILAPLEHLVSDEPTGPSCRVRRSPDDGQYAIGDDGHGGIVIPHSRLNHLNSCSNTTTGAGRPFSRLEGQEGDAVGDQGTVL